MKTNTANPTTRRAARRTLGPALLLAATALLLQGCATARPAWSYKTESNPPPWSTIEQMEPRSGIALLNLTF